MVKMFFLVLHMGVSSGSPMVVMPEKYTIEECNAAGETFVPLRGRSGYVCILAPTSRVETKQ